MSLAMSYLLVGIARFLDNIVATAAAAVTLVLGRIIYAVCTADVFVVHETILCDWCHWTCSTTNHRIRIAFRQRTTVMSNCCVIMMTSCRRTDLIVAGVLIRYRFRFTVSIGCKNGTNVKKCVKTVD